MMKLDSTTTVSFPSSAEWAAYYVKFHKALVNGLNSRYCLADREDAVEEAFHKLMHKKDIEAYGERVPQTEADWFYNLRWQARAYLSHLRERTERHAKYVEHMAETLADVFACGHQGEAMDSEIRTLTLVRALEEFRKEQDVSRRNLEVYTLLGMGEMSVKDLAQRYKTTENNIYAIKFRTGRLLRKYGPRCFERVLQGAGYRVFSAAA